MKALESGDFGVFGPRERAALQFAEKVTLDSCHLDDESFSSLREHFQEGEIVEIAAVAGIFNYFNRFNNALQMEPTK